MLHAKFFSLKLQLVNSFTNGFSFPYRNFRFARGVLKPRRVLVSFRPETALFRNLIVNLRNFLCDVPRYVSAQFLDFLDLAKHCTFLAWKLANVHGSVDVVLGPGISCSYPFWRNRGKISESGNTFDGCNPRLSRTDLPVGNRNASLWVFL